MRGWRRTRPAANAAVALAALLLGCQTGVPSSANPTVLAPTAGAPRTPAVASIEAMVAALTAIEPARNAENLASLDRAAALIGDAFTTAGLQPRAQVFEVNGRRYRNVTALIGRGDRPRMVVGAHYDVAGDQPGADDNASGVAVLVHVAGRLAGRTLPVDIELVAFTLEEPPFFSSADMGSARHAAALAAADVEVVAMLSLEMLGFYSDAPDSQRYPEPRLAERFGTRGDFLAVVGRVQDGALLRQLEAAMAAAGPLPIHVLAAPPGMQGVDYSDHRSYWQAGFVAVMVTDTAFLRNPNYHRAADTAATLDFTRLRQAADAVHDGIVALAGGA